MDLIKQHEKAISILEAIETEKIRIAVEQDNLNKFGSMLTEKSKDKARTSIILAMLKIEKLQKIYTKQLEVITSLNKN